MMHQADEKRQTNSYRAMVKLLTESLSFRRLSCFNVTKALVTNTNAGTFPVIRVPGSGRETFHSSNIRLPTLKGRGTLETKYA